MEKTETTERKIIKERMRLLINYPFFGYLALGLELEEEPAAETIATDGEKLFYNPAFVNSLSPEKLRTVIGHEVLHCALGHLWRREQREHEKWNIAADTAVNLILRKEKFVLPKNCFCNSKFEGMEAELIYAKLPKSSEGRLMDSHKKWRKKKKKRKKKGSSECKGKMGKERKGMSRGASADKENLPKKGKEDMSKGASAGKKDLQKIWKEKVAQAATAVRVRGNLPGGIDALVKDILEPRLDWKTILRNMILSVTKNNFRLIPPSKKHLWRGMYLPSSQGESLEIAMGIDTSGSISRQEFQEFIAEIKGITEQFTDFTLHLFFCDAKIHHRKTLTLYEPWPEKFPKRGGGTDFVPVFDEIAEENLPVSALIYLTDGEGRYPDYPPEYPVIWVLNTNYQVPWGETIKMESK